MADFIDESKRQEYKDYLENAKKTIDKYQESLSYMNNVIGHNQELQVRLELMEEDKKSLRWCVNCKDKFSPLQNEDVSSYLLQLCNLVDFLLGLLFLSCRKVKILLLQVMKYFYFLVDALKYV